MTITASSDAFSAGEEGALVITMGLPEIVENRRLNVNAAAGSTARNEWFIGLEFSSEAGLALAALLTGGNLSKKLVFSHCRFEAREPLAD